MGTILRCQCQTVELRPEHLEAIAAAYDGCLCARCLAQLRDEYDARASSGSPPVPLR